MRPRPARAVIAAFALGLVAAAAFVTWIPGQDVAFAQLTSTTEEESTTTTGEQEETTTTESPIPRTSSTTSPPTTVGPTTTVPPTTAAPTTEAPVETTEAPPPPPPPTTTTAPPPPPPPEDRTPPRQPGQAPVLEDDAQSQVLTTEGAHVHPAFPLLSVGGFAALGGLLGAQWYLTKPDRRGRRTL